MREHVLRVVGAGLYRAGAGRGRRFFLGRRAETLRTTGSDASRVVPADALFLMIGAEPHTHWLPAAVRRDDHGFILTGCAVWTVGASRKRSKGQSPARRRR